MIEDLYLKDYVTHDVLRRLQLIRLREVLINVYKNNPFYKNLFDRAHVKPANLRTLDDLQHFPFTTRQDLQSQPPFGLISVPMQDIVQLQTIGHSTNYQNVVGYTAKDLKIWSELICRSMQCSGLTSQDIILNTYGNFPVDNRLNATIIPMANRNIEQQIMAIHNFNITAICSPPSHFLHLALTAEKMGKSLRTSSLKIGIFGTEPWSDKVRQQIEMAAGILSFNIYGLSEIYSPGIAMQCSEHRKHMHIYEDHFYPEIINPENGQVLPPGEVGELVLTCLTKEAQPLIRYRTGDITRLHCEPCSCGRTLIRMERITQRSDDMIIIRGISLYPAQIKEIIQNEEGISPLFQLIIPRDRNDIAYDFELHLEVLPESFSDEIRKLEALKNRIWERLLTIYGLSAKIILVEPGTLSNLKNSRTPVIDLRNK